MKYNFTSGAELLEKCKELNMTIHELCVEREAELTGISKEEVRDKMRVSLNIMKEAVEKAYRSVEKVHFDNAFYRRDIGKRALTAGEEK